MMRQFNVDAILEQLHNKRKKDLSWYWAFVVIAVKYSLLEMSVYMDCTKIVFGNVLGPVRTLLIL